MTRREPISGAERRALMEACLIEVHSRDLVDLAYGAASDLFGAISKKLGRETALSIFASFNKQASELAHIKNLSLLDLYDMAPPKALRLAGKPSSGKPNLRKLAREIIEEKRKRPAEDHEIKAVSRQIERLLEEREENRARAIAKDAEMRAKLGLPPRKTD